MSDGDSGIPSPCLEEALQIVRDHAFAAEADAGFDGGEFSGPAHDRMLGRELRELADLYGVDPDDLETAVSCPTDLTDEEMFGWADSQERT